MKAILKDDIIINITLSDKGVEIGDIPKGIGLERLRLNGQKVVDLATLNQMYVFEPVPNFYELHILPIGQLVQMTYSNRHNLITSDGAIRIQSPEEIQIENIESQKQLIKNQVRKQIERKTGDYADQLANAYKLIFALIVYTRTRNSTLGSFFDKLIPFVADTYPLNKVHDILLQAVKDIREDMIDYYNRIDRLGE